MLLGAKTWASLAGYIPAVFTESPATQHHDPIAPVILWVTLIFCAH